MSEAENLYKRGRIWWGRVQVHGKDLRRSLRTTDKAKARPRLKRWQEELEHFKFHGEERPTWRQAVVRWAAEFLPGNVKPSVAKRYLTSIRKFDTLFGDLYVDQVTVKVISKYVSQELARKITNATIRRDLTAGASVLRCCVAWTWREDNPFKQYDRDIIQERRDPIRLPPDQEVLTVIKGAPQMMGRMLLALLQTGMREMECGSMEHPQIQPGFTDVLLTITKSNRPRMVPLSLAAAGTLSGTPRHISSQYVFWHDEGEPYRNLPTNFAKLIDRLLNPAYHRKMKAGEKRPVRVPTFRPHDLRHKFAVEWLRENRDRIYDLKNILGHSSVKTTEIYLNYLAQDPAQMKRLAEDWPYNKALKDIAYDDIFKVKKGKKNAVL